MSSKLCKTRIKKSSLDMLNFYVVSGGCDMLNDTDRSTTCRSRIRAPLFHRKEQKMRVLPKTGFSPKKPFEYLRKKSSKLSRLALEKQNKTKQRNHKTPLATTENGPCDHEEMN